MYINHNKTIISFGFCDIQNNQGLGKSYQLQPLVSTDNPYLDLAILDITKTSSNNCLQYTCINVILIQGLHIGLSCIQEPLVPYTIRFVPMRLKNHVWLQQHALNTKGQLQVNDLLS